MPQYTKVYHLSPHANIQRFTGHYSSKIGARGLFVSESWQSVLQDWVATLLAKKFGGRKPSTLIKRRRRLQRQQDLEEQRSDYDEKSPESQLLDQKIIRSWRGSDLGSYKSITIYQLLIPQEVFELCKQEMNNLVEAAFARSGAGAIGAFGWGIETFIFEEFLDQIQIIRRKTYTARHAVNLFGKNWNFRRTHESNIINKMEQYQREIEQLIQIFGRAPLLDRAWRYVTKRRHTDPENASRHYQVIEDLIGPYRRQL